MLKIYTEISEINVEKYYANIFLYISKQNCCIYYGTEGVTSILYVLAKK